MGKKLIVIALAVSAFTSATRSNAGTEIVEDLQAALAQFAEIAGDLTNSAPGA